MNCRIARTWILRELDRDLAVDQALELDEHIARCTACRTLSRRAAALDEALLALGEPPVERLDFERNVRAIGERIEALELERRRHGRAWRIASVLAVSAAIVAVLAWTALRDEDAPRELEIARNAPVLDATTTHAVAAEPRTPNAVESTLPTESRVAEPPPRAERPPVEQAPTIDSQLAESTPSEPQPLAPQATASSDEPAFDLGRLEAARDEMRAHLRAAAASLPALAERSAALAFAATVDEARVTPSLTGWPIVRIAGGLTLDDDELVARAAKRYLGVRGDRLAQRVLQDRWTSDNSDREALLALLDIGEPALDVLARACRSGEIGEFARRRLNDDALAARVLERALRDANAEHAAPEHVAMLVDDLVLRGADAVAALLRLGRDAALEREMVLLAVVRVPQAPRVLGELAQAELARGETVRASANAIDPELLIAACARVQPPDAVKWLAEQCREPRRRSAALETLAAYAAPQAFAALLDLQRETRLERIDLDAPLDAQFARGPEQLLAVTAYLIAFDTRNAALWLEMLVERGDAIAGPSLARLAAAPALPEEDRELAARAVGDFGRTNDVRRLGEVFSGLDGRERRLAAVCVDSIHRLGGDDAVSNVLAGAPRRHTEHVLDVLRKRSPDTVSLVQLSRALDPFFEFSPERSLILGLGSHP